MTIFKCKMCSAPMEVTDGMTVCECEYCGTKQTLPKLDNDSRLNLYDRANHFRRNNEYDKAMGIYERILNEDKTDAEAYWSLVLCRYGIEYVEDPLTHKRVPTVNRAQFTSVYDDDNYKLALEYADVVQRQVYEDEANAINEIQKGILAISQKEAPFDVFICYKETDNDGRRTRDSVLATDLYHQLTNEGFKVFFSRITLEDKLGTAYEPYIFAALNSAKVMVVLGTKPEFFNAVWVKNEWSRYLALIKQGQSKMLIPAYKDMDPYDLPEEFSHLQAQDMSKLGFMQDLVRGIKKIVGEDETQTHAEPNVVVSNKSSEVDPLLKRLYMFLEDRKWESADEYCERILDIDPECAEAYLGKLMAKNEVYGEKELITDWYIEYNNDENYEKILRFADENLKNKIYSFIYTSALAYMDFDEDDEEIEDEIDSCKDAIELFETILNHKDVNKQIEICKKKIEDLKIKKENFRKDGVLSDGKSKMTGEEISSYEEAIKIFERIPGWKDADEQIKQCNRRIEEIKIQQENDRKDNVLKDGKSKMTGEEISSYEAAIKVFETISGWKDADEQIEICNKKIVELKKQAEIDKKKNKKIISIVAAIAVFVVVVVMVYTKVIVPKQKLKTANELVESGEYEEAYTIYKELGEMELLEEAKGKAIDTKVNKLVETERYTEAMASYRTFGTMENKDIIKDKPFIYAMNESISAGSNHTVGLRNDGTVVSTKVPDFLERGQCEVSDWTDIVAISTGSDHTVGLKSDGTVVATEYRDNQKYYEGQCDVKRWRNIVSISANSDHTVGLRSDGTVVAVGSNSHGKCKVSDWTDIVAVSAGGSHTVGLKSDGTVVATEYRGNQIDNHGQCEVSDWTDIVAVSAGTSYTVGLKSDGTVVATEYRGDQEYYHGQCEVSDWTDIVAISAGGGHTVGLRSDGTIVAVGDNNHGQCEVSDWTDIVAISARGGHTVGLRSDGTVVSTEYIGDQLFNVGQCEVSDWSDIALVPMLHLPENWGVN